MAPKAVRSVAASLVVLSVLASVALGSQAGVSTSDPCAGAVEELGRQIRSRRVEWLEASPTQRIAIAEEIGEEGAEALMKHRGLSPLLTRLQKSLPQGIDQVWVNPKTGQVSVVQAKGGTSAIDLGYGYLQGTSEWAVEAAKKTLKSSSASEAEKVAAKRVLEAAGKGRLRVVVVRTEHAFGKPAVPCVEKLSNTSDDAARLAREALDELAGAGWGAERVAKNASKSGDDIATATAHKGGRAASAISGSSDDAARAASRSADDVLRTGSQQAGHVGRTVAKVAKGTRAATHDTSRAVAAALAQSSDDAARAGAKGAVGAAKAARGVAKAAPIVAVGLEVGVRGKDIWDTEQAFRAGEITAQERAGRHGGNAGACVGGTVGAWAGAKGGALAGGAIGALFGGVGAPIGAAAGGIIGAIGGAIAGDRVGAEVGKAAGRELAS